MFKSKSYKTCCSCDAHCLRSDDATEQQPCWGEVDAIDEIPSTDDDWTWLHGCQGHINYDWTGSVPNVYIPEPK